MSNFSILKNNTLDDFLSHWDTLQYYLSTKQMFKTEKQIQVQLETSSLVSCGVL